MLLRLQGLFCWLVLLIPDDSTTLVVAQAVLAGALALTGVVLLVGSVDPG